MEELWNLTGTEKVPEKSSRKQGSTIAYDVRVEWPEGCDTSGQNDNTSKTPMTSQKDTLKSVECMSSFFSGVHNSETV